MIWPFVMRTFSILLDWLSPGRNTEQGRSLEILLLRRQPAILGRWLRTVHEECHDKLLLINERQMRQGMDE
jgi:hypothetical protein